MPTQPLVEPIDAFVTKLDADGDALLYSGHLGGINYDEGRGIAVDACGNSYVTGVTQSFDFPTKNAFQPMFVGTLDAFVTKISAR